MKIICNYWFIFFKKKYLKTILLLLFISCFSLVLGKTPSKTLLSEHSEISVLTIGPGEYLYDKFGHSAFRVKDSIYGVDLVFNYGSYDFNTPNFYIKFARGKLLYALEKTAYHHFYKSYVYQNRYIKEQQLNLSDEEKNKLFEYLNNNALAENKNYKYDFFYDNCATRIRDVLANVLKENIHYPENLIKEKETFRSLIQKNVAPNTWGSLGMDIAIGAVTDVKATDWEYQFLPEYVFQTIEKSFINKGGVKEPFVKRTSFLFKNTPKSSNQKFLFSPLFVFGVLGSIILFVTYKNYKNNKRSRFLDSFLFLFTGSIGVLLFLLWTATDHSTTANNYNMLWAFPLSLFAIYPISKKQPKNWVRKYVVFLIILLALLMLHAVTGVQQFAISSIPLLVVLLIRYIYIIFILKRIQH